MSPFLFYLKGSDCMLTGFNERQLGNGKYRYEGKWHGVSFSIDSIYIKTKEDIVDFLEDRSTDYLLGMEGYIINLVEFQYVPIKNDRSFTGCFLNCNTCNTVFCPDRDF